jgi:4-carboxymuconolactone decarboxylase
MDEIKGTEMWRRVMVNDPPAMSTPFTTMTKDHVFGEVWSRPGLTTRDRRLVSLTCTALAPGPALAIHVEAALKSGDLDVEAIEEWLIHLAHYAGWPTAANAYVVTRDVLARYRDVPAG